MKKMSIIALLLVAVLVTSSSVSGTYAKYTSAFTSETASAKVAAWAFQIDDVAATNNFNFDLFKTINDTDGSVETDVKVVEGEKIIAPGTTGSFVIKLKNISEVNAKYSVDYTVTKENGNIPLEFKVGEAEWTSNIDELDMADAAVINMDETKTVTVQWRWAYQVTGNASDVTDTALGVAGNPVIKVSAKVTVTQID